MRPARRTAFLGAALAGVSWLVAPAVEAQTTETTTAAVQIEQVDVADYPEVELVVSTAHELDGRALTAENFGLTEDGSPLQAVVEPIDNEGLEVVLAIDTSGSMRGEALASAQVASLGFVDRLPDVADVAVIAFGDTAQVVAPFGSGPDAVRAAVLGLEAAGETALFDGTITAVNTLTGTNRAAIVLLSDGGDTASTAVLDDAVARLGDFPVEFHAVELRTGESDRAALDRLAEGAQGRVAGADDPGALAAAYESVAQRISNRYRLTFVSEAADPSATLEVTVSVDDVTTGASASVVYPGVAVPVAVAQTVPPPPAVAVDAGLLGANWMIWIGAGAVFLAVAFVAAAVLTPPEHRRRLVSDAPDPVDDLAEWGGAVRQMLRTAGERLMAPTRSPRALDARLDRAGLAWRPGEFVLASAGFAVGLAVLGWLLGGPIFALIFAGGGAAAPFVLLWIRTQRRNSAFGDQLGDTLLMMAGSLRAGHGLGSAVDSVAREMPSPTSEEFGRVVLERRLGREVEDCLASVADRVQNEDFEWVVEAIRIHRQVGGDLAEILDQVSETIRARARLARHVQALTAEGRLSALVLFCLPFVMALLVASGNTGYLDPLFTETLGRLMLGGALALLTAGGLWLRQLVQPDF